MKPTLNFPSMPNRPYFKQSSQALCLFLASFGFSSSLKSEPIPPTIAPTSALSAEWTSLLDQNLTNWELWMGCPHKTVKGLPPETPLSEDSHGGTPLGLNNDPKKVFSVFEEADEPVLQITGEIYGGLTTKNSYSNYHFRCQFKWGTLKWEPRLKAARDNGILLHCTGRHGAFWNVWKQSVEFQVQERDMGDLYLLSGAGGQAYFTGDATNPERQSYDPTSNDLSHGGKVKHLNGAFESPLGEWNALEVLTMGRTAVFLVNGTVVQAVRNMQCSNPKGAGKIPLYSGQIQLQCEGAEAFYRRVEIKSLSKYPEEIQKSVKFTAEELK
jgi:Domain of Unknown Function (DUF1080)